MMVKKLTNGVHVIECIREMFDNVKKHPDSEVMSIEEGQGIKEHKHNTSSYFAKNAMIVIEGDRYKIPKNSIVHIDENISHGWIHSGISKNIAEIASFDPGHDVFEIYSL